MTLVLASQSATRVELCKRVGLDVTIDPAHLDEDALKDRSRDIADVARDLAVEKARVVSARWPDAHVIGADQMLECAGVWMDKPETRNAARERLQLLRGKPHMLYTGVAVVCNGVVLWNHVSRTTVVMRNFSDELLDWYLDTADPSIYKTVGGYRHESSGACLIKSVDSDSFTVAGLPLLELLDYLQTEGFYRYDRKDEKSRRSGLAG